MSKIPIYRGYIPTRLFKDYAFEDMMIPTRLLMDPFLLSHDSLMHSHYLDTYHRRQYNFD